MRRAIAVFLSASLLFAQAAQARNLSEPEAIKITDSVVAKAGPAAFESVRWIDGDQMSKDLDKLVENTDPSKREAFQGALGSVVVFVVTMEVIAFAKGILSLAFSQHRTPTAAEIKAAIHEGAKQAVDQIVMGVTMGGAFSLAVDKPMKILTALATNPKTYPILSAIFERSASNTITLMGWSAGVQLWTEAQYLIKDQAQYERSQHIWQVTFGSVASPADRQVLGLMLKNMFLVAVWNPKLQAEWFSNVWRLHVMTGEFATMVAGMVAGTTIGTAIFPGAGTLTGLMLGAAYGAIGASVAMYLPQSWKDKITAEARHMRRNTINGSLQANAKRLEQSVATSEYIPPTQNPFAKTFGASTMQKGIVHLDPLQTGPFGANVPVAADTRLGVFKATWSERQAYRENRVTLNFEIIRDAISRASTGELAMTDAINVINKNFSQAQSLYTSEQQLLLQVATLDNGKTPSLIDQISQASDDLNTLNSFLSDLGPVLTAELQRMGAQYDPSGLPDDARKIAKYIEVVYQRGFVESRILNP